MTARATTAGVAATLTLAAVAFGACGGGDGANSDEVGAHKAACNNAPNFALAAFRPAALPPEPVEVLLPKAKFVVEARALSRRDATTRGQ